MDFSGLPQPQQTCYKTVFRILRPFLADEGLVDSGRSVAAAQLVPVFSVPGGVALFKLLSFSFNRIGDLPSFLITIDAQVWRLSGPLLRRLLAGYDDAKIDKRAQIMAIRKQALSIYDGGDWKTAGALYERLLSLAKQTGDPKLIRDAHSDLANCYSGNDDACAIHHLKERLGISRRIGQAEDEAAGLGFLGSIYLENGAGDDAIDCFTRILDITANPTHRRMAISSLGSCCLVSQRFQEALRWFQQLEPLLVQNDLPSVAEHASGVCTAYLGLGKFEDAERYGMKALKVHEKLGDKFEQSRDWAQLALVFQAAHQDQRHSEALKKQRELELQVYTE